MAYFKEFPKLIYSTSLGIKNFKTVTNIFANIRFIKEILSNSDLYYTYDVKDGEKPEDIAAKMYNDVEKHWIILLANGVVDPQYDWVMGQNAFENYINKKYSSLNLNLPTTDIYRSNYVNNEVVYQGDSVSDANCKAQVANFNSVTKLLQVKFPNQTIANGEAIIGNTSNENHKIMGVTVNNDGYNWAVNTASHYQVTETRYNSFDKVKNTITYSVSALDYNYATDSVVSMPLGYSNTSSLLSDGTTLYIEKFIGQKNFYDVEVDKNEAKRKIKLPKPQYVLTIEQQFNRLMRKA
jgi:hypothetical protein